MYDASIRKMAGYVVRTYSNGNQIKVVLTKLKTPTMIKPTKPTPENDGGSVDEIDKDIYRKDIEG